MGPRPCAGAAVDRRNTFEYGFWASLSAARAQLTRGTSPDDAPEVIHLASNPRLDSRKQAAIAHLSPRGATRSPDVPTKDNTLAQQ